MRELISFLNSIFEIKLKKKNDEDLFHALILEMYKKVKDTKSLAELKRNLYDSSYIKSLINNYIYINLEMVSSLIGSLINIYLDRLNDEHIYNLITGNKGNSIEERINE